jgi:hypothetical protein
MPYLETDYDKGYKAGKQEAQDFKWKTPTEIAYERGKRDGASSTLGLDQDAIDRILGRDSKQYEKGKSDGFADEMGIPRRIDLSDFTLKSPYEQGFEAGKKAASKELFPSGKSEFSIEAE